MEATTLKKKSIAVLATILVLALGAGTAMAQMWGGCGMWGSGGYGNTYATTAPGPNYCPMVGNPGSYYCPVTGNGHCALTTAPGQNYQYDTVTGTPTQYYPAVSYSGWGCW